jgi:uncharacterized membrane protein
VSGPGLPVAVHEFLIAPASLGLAFRHARRALGTRRAAGELGALVAYGFALERLAMSAFHSHLYGAGWIVAPLGVPLAVAMVWAAVISSALALAARAGMRTAPARALAAALFAMTLDLTMEPVAVRCLLWRWTPPGPWLGVPIGNFVGWLVIVAGYGLGAERWAGDGGFVAETLRRIALAAAALAALVGVGLAWTRLDLESALGRRGGWLVWGLVLVATAAAGWWRRPPFAGATLAGRLGAAPGFAPALVLLVVATAFAADAALVADRTIALVALGTALALVPALRPI